MGYKYIHNLPAPQVKKTKSSQAIVAFRLKYTVAKWLFRKPPFLYLELSF